MKSPRSLILLALALLTLSACGSVRESLGLGRNPPDEFAVVDRPPLAMPPDFGLRPPQPGAPRPQEVDTKQRASDALFAGNSDTNSIKGVPVDNSGVSRAEKALLDNSGASKADPNIRETVDREDSTKVVGSEHLVDDLLWWKKDESPSTTVDPVAEAKRIEDNKDKGVPINQGATPVIERDKSGWLGL